MDLVGGDEDAGLIGLVVAEELAAAPEFDIGDGLLAVGAEDEAPAVGAGDVAAAEGSPVHVDGDGGVDGGSVGAVGGHGVVLTGAEGALVAAVGGDFAEVWREDAEVEVAGGGGHLCGVVEQMDADGRGVLEVPHLALPGLHVVFDPPAAAVEGDRPGIVDAVAPPGGGVFLDREGEVGGVAGVEEEGELVADHLAVGAEALRVVVLDLPGEAHEGVAFPLGELLAGNGEEAVVARGFAGVLEGVPLLFVEGEDVFAENHAIEPGGFGGRLPVGDGAFATAEFGAGADEEGVGVEAAGDHVAHVLGLPAGVHAEALVQIVVADGEVWLLPVNGLTVAVVGADLELGGGDGAAERLAVAGGFAEPEAEVAEQG